MCVPIYCAVILASTNVGRIDVWAAIGAGAGVYLFYKGFRMLQRKRLILDTPGLGFDPVASNSRS